MLPIFIFLTLTFSHGSDLPYTVGDSQSESVFTQALQTFKAQEYAKSRDLFKTLLTQNPDDKVLLYNLGLVEFSESRFGAALGYWRRALWISPGYSPALEGVSQLHKKLPTTNDSSFLGSLYLRVPPWLFLGASCLLLLSCGFLSVNNLQKTKNGKAAYWFLPSSLGLLFLGAATVTTHYFFIFAQEEHATLIEGNTALYSSPSETAPSLVNLPEGTDVLILRKQESEDPKNQWIQVKKSSIQVGWIQKDKIFIHSGI